MIFIPQRTIEDRLIFSTFILIWHFNGMLNSCDWILQWLWFHHFNHLTIDATYYHFDRWAVPSQSMCSWFLHRQPCSAPTHHILLNWDSSRMLFISIFVEPSTDNLLFNIFMNIKSQIIGRKYIVDLHASSSINMVHIVLIFPNRKI